MACVLCAAGGKGRWAVSGGAFAVWPCDEFLFMAVGSDLYIRSITHSFHLSESSAYLCGRILGAGDVFVVTEFPVPIWPRYGSPPHAQLSRKSRHMSARLTWAFR